MIVSEPFLGRITIILHLVTVVEVEVVETRGERHQDQHHDAAELHDVHQHPTCTTVVIMIIFIVTVIKKNNNKNMEMADQRRNAEKKVAVEIFALL